MSIVAETVLTYIPAKRKTTPSGWISFNAPCCHHNGHTADTRGRGGVIQEADTISYHCFNCGFKCSWQQGRNVSHKLRKFLQWIGTPDDVINKVALDVMRENEGVEITKHLAQLPTFSTVPMPETAKPLSEWADYCALEPGGIDKNLYAIFEYMKERSLYLDDTTYYWTPELAYRDRLIIPFYYEERIVGWTARTVRKNKQPKYMSEQQPGYVFGLDEQRPQKIFVIVCEGPIDALHVDGCALLGSEISDQQAMLLNRLDKDVIIVPDRDKAGSKLVEQAIELGYHVSMPDWDQDITDIGDAVDKYGRLYTLHSIAVAMEDSPLKIRLKAKKWFTSKKETI